MCPYRNTNQKLTSREIIEFILIFGVGFVLTHVILSLFATITPFDRFLFRIAFFGLYVLCIYSLKRIFDLDKKIRGIENKLEKKEEPN